jgi:hypothetical protein
MVKLPVWGSRVGSDRGLEKGDGREKLKEA